MGTRGLRAASRPPIPLGTEAVCGLAGVLRRPNGALRKGSRPVCAPDGLGEAKGPSGGKKKRAEMEGVVQAMRKK